MFLHHPIRKRSDFDLFRLIAQPYIPPSWGLAAKTLETTYVPADHTAAVLSEELQECCQAWGITDDKVARVTTDNSANIVAAVRNLQWPWLNCFGHNLTVAVNNAIKKDKTATDHAFGTCRAINGAFAHSWLRRRELRKAQDELELPEHNMIAVSSYIG